MYCQANTIPIFFYLKKEKKKKKKKKCFQLLFASPMKNKRT